MKPVRQSMLKFDNTEIKLDVMSNGKNETFAVCLKLSVQ